MVERVVDDFYQKHFNIDEFLNDETEKKDLKDILKSLVQLKNENSNTMSTVLKEQTESVISIAEKLQSLHNKIDTLHSPISQLREEVMSLSRQVNDTVKSFDDKLLNEKELNLIKWNLTALAAYHLISRHTRKLIEKYLDSEEKKTEHLERIVSKYAFHVHILEIFNIHPDKEDNIEGPLKKLLKEKFLGAFKQHNINDLRRVVHMYLFLKKKDDLIQILRNNILKPLLEPILCEENLRRNNDSMKILYNDALKVLTSDLNIFNTVMSTDNIEDFNITLDCYWFVVDRLLRKNLICITAAGHADIFFKHFMDTIHFLESISSIYGNENLIKENESLVRHLKRFNMLVYYEIRHQEVSSTFESTILQASHSQKRFYSDSLNHSSKIYLKLQVSISLYIQLVFLFHSTIFIKLLSDQFLKSLFLLVSRYITWVDEIIVQNSQNDSEIQRFNLICLLCDLHSLKTHFGFNGENNELINKSIFHVVDPTARPLLNEILKINNQNLANYYNKVKDAYVAMTTNEVVKCLQNVTSIPRLYRRTNKAPPSDHSSYVNDAMKPILYFQRYFNVENAILTNDHWHIMDEIVNICSKEYLNLVAEVLTSVGKTEESLRRLKLRNAANNEEGRSDINSDESKIRQQIKIDVSHFVQEINKLVSTKNSKSLQELLQKSGN